MRTSKRRSVTSVTSTGTTTSDRNRNNSNASQVSHGNDVEDTTRGTAAGEHERADKKDVLAYKVAMLGDPGVGKTALTYQFTTSDYICAYDLSLGNDSSSYITYNLYINIYVVSFRLQTMTMAKKRCPCC